MEIALKGIGVSPGIAIGPALTFGVQSLDVPKYAISDDNAELSRYERAVSTVRSELARLRAKVAAEVGERHAEIFSAQLMMLEDVTIRDEIENRLKTEHVNVEYLVDDLLGRYVRIMETVDDPMFRERNRDMYDVGNRLLSTLLGAELDSLAKLDRPSIIVAHDLSPSDTASMDVANTLAIACDLGGPTSHTAILARAFEIPAVVGLKFIGRNILPGDTIIVDGTRGYVHIRPSQTTISECLERKQKEDASFQALVRTERDSPSVTLDKHLVPTLCNIELPIEISHVQRVKAHGIGLFRTEYLFMNRAALPTEEDQYCAYALVAEALKPGVTTIRTFDLGGDKFSSHLEWEAEANPQLGWRSIRVCLERPDIFKTQIRAVLRASIRGNVQIMFPLISGVDEIRRVKAVVSEVMEDLSRDGVPFNKDIAIGCMIEVPAAVVCAEELARECSFFSIGTNDLIQYLLAVDRVNERVAAMYEPAHPAVLRMIRQTVDAAQRAGIPCGVCGEMAGDPRYTELLIGLEVDSLSMSPVAIAAVRAEIARISYDEARLFAQRVLRCGEVEGVGKLLAERISERAGIVQEAVQSRVVSVR